MPEWEEVQDQNATGLSLRWRKISGEHEFRIFHDEHHVVHEPEEIHGLSWIAVIRQIRDGQVPRYIYWGAHPTAGAAKDYI
jgi:hypothetical protein